MMLPFSMAVQALPRTVEQLRANHFSIFDGSAKPACATLPSARLTYRHACGPRQWGPWCDRLCKTESPASRRHVGLPEGASQFCREAGEGCIGVLRLGCQLRQDRISGGIGPAGDRHEGAGEQEKRQATGLH
jgi:hypothetical protein